MSQFNPHAQVEIFEEQGSQNKKVEANNELWDSWLDKRLFASVRVQLETNQSSQVEISVVDPDYKFLDRYSRKDGVPWLAARVWLGFGEQLGEPVFKGLLASPEHDSPNSLLRFYDMGFKMKVQQKTEYHAGLDIDVMRKLVVRNGLQFMGPGAGVKGLPLQSKKQEAQTDWDFLLNLAEEAGLIIYVRGDTVFAQPPARTGNAVLSLGRRDVRMMEDSYMRYRVPENLEGRPRRLEVRGRDKGGKRLAGVSDTSKRGTDRVVIKRSIKHASKSEAERRARAKKELQREHAFECRVRSILQTNIRADVRQTIELVDHGLLFSGKYLVNAVDHDFSPGRLETDYDFYRDFEDAGR